MRGLNSWEIFMLKSMLADKNFQIWLLIGTASSQSEAMLEWANEWLSWMAFWGEQQTSGSIAMLENPCKLKLNLTWIFLSNPGAYWNEESCIEGMMCCPHHWRGRCWNWGDRNLCEWSYEHAGRDGPTSDTWLLWRRMFWYCSLIVEALGGVSKTLLSC